MKLWARYLFFIFLFFFPTQLGKHFWFSESLVLGRKIDFLSPTFYLTDFLLIAAFIVSFFVPSEPKTQTIGRRVWICILSLVSISLLIAPFKLPVLYYGTRLVEMALLVLIISRLKPTLSMVLVPLATGVLIEAFLALAQFLAQKNLGGVFWFLGERTFTSETPGIAQIVYGGKLLLRPYGTFPHPNVLGGYLAVILPLFLGWGAKIKNQGTRIKVKFLWLLRQSALALSFLGIALSFSRSAWVVTLGILAIYSYKKSRRAFLKLVVLIACLVLVEELFLGRILSIQSFDRDTLLERAKLTQAALKLAQTAPVFGHGLGNFIPLLPGVATPPYLFQPAHSIYLLILAETGMFGLVLFTVLIFSTLRVTWKGRQFYLMLALFAALTLGIVDHYFLTLSQGQLLLAFLLGYSTTPFNSVK